MAETDNARVVALAEQLGAQIARLKGAGPKLVQFLSMLRFDGGPAPAGARPPGVEAVAFSRVRRVIEDDLGARVGQVFADFDETPFALSSLGQVHRARTRDGDDVAVKVQHPGVAEAVEADLRNLGFVGPILKRLAPGLDAGAMLAEVRERVSDELDYEVEAQHQRRLERAFRGHPHVRLPRVHTDLSERRVLVSEYVEGIAADDIAQLSDAERDRVGEIAFRFYAGLAWRAGLVAGDPQPENCLLCPDGRLCLLDFALLRELDAGCRDGERAVMQALAAGDAARVHEHLSGLGYLPEPAAPDALLEVLTSAGGWMFDPGVVRLDPQCAAEILDRGYPPRSPHFMLMRRLSLPAPTLLLRRMELQLLSLLGELRAGADWGAIAAEHHSDRPASTALGREDRAFFARR
jgi:ABC1 family protein